ncbi:hypothetical protein ACFV98_21190 [Streptomyces violascens]|uniref:hypothetical protein n=1 Tax=Streptomyces violascens TaxID=67381 RepID=UPI0036624814
MSSTIRALLIDATGTLTDLHLDADEHRQYTQVHDALGGRFEVIRNVHTTYGPATTALVNDEFDKQPLNAVAAHVLSALLNEDLAAITQGPVLFVGRKNTGALTSVPEAMAARIRALCPATTATPTPL